MDDHTEPNRVQKDENSRNEAWTKRPGVKFEGDRVVVDWRVTGIALVTASLAAAATIMLLASAPPIAWFLVSTLGFVVAMFVILFLRGARGGDR